MKTVRIIGGMVHEIVPEEVVTIGVAACMGAAFAAECIEAPDEVLQNWSYNDQTGTFSPPSDVIQSGPAADPLLDIKLAIAELAEAQTADKLANELAIAELAETILGGK